MRERGGERGSKEEVQQKRGLEGGYGGGTSCQIRPAESQCIAITHSEEMHSCIMRADNTVPYRALIEPVRLNTLHAHCIHLIDLAIRIY
jgi:hypothetical protein